MHSLLRGAMTVIIVHMPHVSEVRHVNSIYEKTVMLFHLGKISVMISNSNGYIVIEEEMLKSDENILKLLKSTKRMQ